MLSVTVVFVKYSIEKDDIGADPGVEKSHTAVQMQTLMLRITLEIVCEQFYQQLNI